MENQKIIYPSMNQELLNEIPCCGCCGDPEPVYELFHDWLKDIADEKFHHLNKYERDKDVDIKFRYLLLYLFDKLELIEHGTTIHCPWITDKGKDLILILDKFKEIDYDFHKIINLSFKSIKDIDFDSEEFEYWWTYTTSEDYDKICEKHKNKYKYGVRVG